MRINLDDKLNTIIRQLLIENKNCKGGIFMMNKLLKKTMSLIMFFLIISMNLNNSVYSLVLSSNYDSISSQIEINNEIRLQDDFYSAVNREWLSNAKLQEDVFLMVLLKKCMEELTMIFTTLF